MAYQGWKNRATWAAALHIDNDRGAYENWLYEADFSLEDAPRDENVKEGIWTPGEAALFRLEDKLKTAIEEDVELAKEKIEDPFITDMLQIGTEDIDTLEVAHHLMNNLCESKDMYWDKDKKACILRK